MTRLLLVDDNEQNLYMLRVLLEGHGYEVVAAEHGAEALDKARQDRPDMIITDILMPVMDGFTLCRQWKQDPTLKDIPFVFYTATYTDPQDEAFALSLGAERFIVKPVEPDMFVGLLQEVIEEHEAGRLVAPREPVEEEAVYFREYNEALVRKLEDKMVQLEEANRALQREIGERMQVQEALRRSLEETARGHGLLLALSNAAQAVQRARTPQEVYRTIGDEVAGLGYCAAILALTDDGEHLTVSHLAFDSAMIRAAEKLTGLSAEGYRFPLRPDGPFQCIIAEGSTIFAERPAEYAAGALPAPLRPLASRLAALLGAEQGILAPLTVGDEPYGLLAVTGTDLSQADVPAIATFARQAGIAIENARLFHSLNEQREQLRGLTVRLAEAEEEERRRLARELHDRVGQNLTALSINLNIVREQLPAELAAQQPGNRLDESLELVEQTAGHIRDVMSELRPAVLDDYGLRAALHWYGERYSQRTGVTTVVEGEELTPRLPPAVETALFRIAQEALTNVARYARAGQVTLTLQSTDGGARLSIADDGVGFDPTAAQRPGQRAGWGLLTMRERAEAVGGHLLIDSAPGRGTRVVVEVRRD